MIGSTTTSPTSLSTVPMGAQIQAHTAFLQASQPNVFIARTIGPEPDRVRGAWNNLKQAVFVPVGGESIDAAEDLSRFPESTWDPHRLSGRELSILSKFRHKAISSSQHLIASQLQSLAQRPVTRSVARAEEINHITLWQWGRCGTQAPETEAAVTAFNISAAHWQYVQLKDHEVVLGRALYASVLYLMNGEVDGRGFDHIVRFLDALEFGEEAIEPFRRPNRKKSEKGYAEALKTVVMPEIYEALFLGYMYADILMTADFIMGRNTWKSTRRKYASAIYHAGREDYIASQWPGRVLHHVGLRNAKSKESRTSLFAVLRSALKFGKK